MTKTEKILLPVILVAAVAMCGLWIKESRQNTTLARELQERQDELAQVEAVRKGLEQANTQLKTRLTEVEQAAIALQSAPRMMAEIPERSEEVPEFVDVYDEPEPPQTNEENQEPTILSPEELAAKQKREEESAAQQAEREQRRKEFAARVTAEIQTRKAFFSQINTEGLAPEYQEANRKLLESLDYVEGLMVEMHDPELSRDERRKIGRELWSQSREMSGLMDMQRDILLNDYAELSLGLTREQTQDFMDYMEMVNQMTTGSPMRGRSR